MTKIGGTIRLNCMKRTHRNGRFRVRLIRKLWHRVRFE